MQKYIKNDLSEIHYFEAEVVVSDWIDLNEFRVMTADEILQNETLKPSEFNAGELQHTMLVAMNG